ncbi:MAG: hypothetical protein O7E52_28545 [Candidatus Poribacteria bacterium]|nr:hypothetical protein [Candidatus Poribacteria bacterium]
MRTTGIDSPRTSFTLATHRITELKIREQAEAAENEVAQTPEDHYPNSEDTAGRSQPNPPGVGTYLDIRA